MDLQDDHGESALHIAAWHGLPRVLHVLGEVGARLDTRNRDLETAVHCAAARGHLRCVRQLLRLGADPNLQDKNGCTALHLALRRRHSHIAMLLLRQPNVRLDLVDLHGDTPLHIACRQRLLTVVQLLCVRSTSATVTSGSSQSKTGNDSAVQQQDWLDRKNRVGDTPLHLAIRAGHVELVRTLCAAGADVHMSSSDNMPSEPMAQRLLDQFRQSRESERDCADAACILQLLKLCSSHKSRCSLLSQLRPNWSSSADLTKEHPTNTSTGVACNNNEQSKLQCVNCAAKLLKTKSGCCNQTIGTCVANERASCCNRVPDWMSHWFIKGRKSFFISRESPVVKQNSPPPASSSSPTLPVQLQKCKIVLLGHSGVGKSTLVDTLRCGYFSGWLRKPKHKPPHHPQLHPQYSARAATSCSATSSTATMSAAPSFTSLASSVAESTNVAHADDLSLRHSTGNWSGSTCACDVQRTLVTSNDGLQPDGCTGPSMQVQPLHVPGVGELIVWSFGAACADLALADRLLDRESLHLLLLRADDPFETQLSQAHYWLRLLVNALPVQQPLGPLGRSARPVSIQIVYTHFDELPSSQQQLPSATPTSTSSSSSQQQSAEQASTTIAAALVQQCVYLQQKYEHLLRIHPTPVLMDAGAANSSGVKQLKHLLLEEKEHRLRLLGPTCALIENCVKHLQQLRNPPQGSPLITQQQLIQSFQQNLNPLVSRSQLRLLCYQLQLLGELHPLHNSRIDGVDLLLLDPIWFSNRVLGSVFKPLGLSQDQLDSSPRSTVHSIFVAGEEDGGVTLEEKFGNNDDEGNLNDSSGPEVVIPPASSFSSSSSPTTPLPSPPLASGFCSVRIPTASSASSALSPSLRLSLDQLQSLQPQTDALDLLLLLQNLELCSSSEGEFEYLFPAQFTAAASLRQARSLSISGGCLSTSSCLATSGYLSNSAVSVATACCGAGAGYIATGVSGEDGQLAVLLQPAGKPNPASAPSLNGLFGRLQVLLESVQQAASIAPDQDQVHLLHQAGQLRVLLLDACVTVCTCQGNSAPSSALYVHLSACNETATRRGYRLFELLINCLQALIGSIWPGQYLARHYVSVAHLRRNEPRPFTYCPQQINQLLMEAVDIDGSPRTSHNGDEQNEWMNLLQDRCLTTPDGSEDRLDFLLTSGVGLQADLVRPDRLVAFELQLQEQLVRLRRSPRTVRKERLYDSDDDDLDSEQGTDETENETLISPYFLDPNVDLIDGISTVEGQNDDDDDDDDEDIYDDRNPQQNVAAASTGNTCVDRRSDWADQLVQQLHLDFRSDPQANQLGPLRPVASCQLHVCDLPMAALQAFCELFDRPHEFGLDWCLLGVQLKMTDKLPMLDGSSKTTSSTWRLLKECGKQADFTVAKLCNILHRIGRLDARQMLLEAVDPVQLLSLHSHTLRLALRTVRKRSD